MTENTTKAKDEVSKSALRKSALTGSAWATAGFGIAQVVRLISNIALASLLFPEAFALMAIVATITSGFAMLTDIGLGPNIVQSKRGDDVDFLNTAWTIQILRGVALAAIVALMAWPVAAFYAANDPMAWELRGIIPVVALGILIDAFQSTKMRTATRHLNLGRATLVQLGAQCVGIAVMLLIAWQTRSVYSMAVGGVVTALFQTAFSHLALPGLNNRLRWERPAVLEIVHFGKWVVVSTMIYFFSVQIDKLVFGRIFSLAEVGVYSIGAGLALMPTVLMGRLQSSVVFPLYARMLDRGETLPAAVQRTKGPLLTLAAYIFTLSVACSASFVALAYDTQYEAAGIYMPILAAGAWFSTVGGTFTSAFLAVGKSRWVAICSGIRLMIFCVMLFPAIHWGGFLGAVVLVGMTDVLKLPALIVFARKLGLRNLHWEFWLTVFSCTLGGAILWASSSWKTLVEFNPYIQIACQFFAVTLAFTPLFFKAGRMLIQQKKRS
jgi:O-antigen/teichoic acid export membrane protein